MTTTVLIGTQGNKAVTLKTPNGDLVLQPGRWLTLGIHGEQAINVQEVGDFVDAGPATTAAPASA